MVLLAVAVLLYFIYTHQTMVFSILEYFSFMRLVIIIGFIAFVIFAIIYGVLCFVMGKSVENFMKEKCPKCDDYLWCEESVSEVRTCLRKHYMEETEATQQKI